MHIYENNEYSRDLQSDFRRAGRSFGRDVCKLLFSVTQRQSMSIDKG